MPITYTNLDGVICSQLSSQERIDQLESPIARKLFQDLHDELQDAFGVEVPTNQLDGEGNPVTRFVSAREIDNHREVLKRQAAESEYMSGKRAKAERIECYADQVASMPVYTDKRTIEDIADPTAEQLQFIEDERRLHRNQVLFCKFMIEKGILSEEDFDDDELEFI